MRTLLTLSTTLLLVSLALLLNATTGLAVSNGSTTTATTISSAPALQPVSTSGQTTIRLPGVGVLTLQIAAGGTHTCALTTAGVFCWGNNDYGQLGNGTITSQVVPTLVLGLEHSVTAITTGFHHTCALAAGTVYCWGNNDNGQLGDGTNNNQSTPVAVSGLGSDVVAIAAGYNQTCALTTGGGVKCWGNNVDGKLGDGTTINQSTPVNVSELSSGVTAIAAGYNHSCALTTVGAVHCWGGNENGELGDGTTTSRLTPVATQQLSNNVIAIASSSAHTCALTSEGQVQCWGRNSNGQLGDGTATSRWVPVNVSGLESSVTQITAAGEHACALFDDTTELTNQVQCWGYNGAGQLGNGATSNQYTPVAVGGLSSRATAISAGGEHTCALTALGAVQCWGNNSRGQLGDGTTTNRSTPVTVSGLADSYTTLHDAGDLVRWQTLTYTYPLPAGIPFTLTVRASNTGNTNDDSHWGAWITLGDSPADLSSLPPSRYLQMRATSTTELPTTFDLGVLTWGSFTYTPKSGILNTNTTWPAIGSPYVITGTLVVAQNRTLTLEPGAELWFRDKGRLQVRGGLIALGTPTQPITLTSWHVGKQPGDWHGVVFESTAISSTFNNAGVYTGGSALQHTTIEAAGYSSRYAVDAPTIPLFVQQSTIRNNSAGGLRSHGGIVINNLIADNFLNVTSDTNGVGIANDGGGWIIGNTVTSNQASASGWSYRVYGGGIYSSGGGQVTDNTVRGNRIYSVDAAFGGGIYASGGVVAGNTVQANVQTALAYGHGGGLAIDNAQVTDNQVLSNTVDAHYYTYGGGIHSTAGVLQNNIVAGNRAYGRQSGGRGGGLYQIAGGTVVANQIYANQVAAESNSTWAAGGGIYATDGATTLRNNRVSANRANQAGGVYSNGASVTDNQIRNNHAVSNAGALWWVGDQSMSYNTLSDNTSSGATGGIYIESGYPHLFANRVQDNSGYALYNNNGYVNINTTVNAHGNWWGPVDADAIQNLLFDYNDDPDKGPVNVEEPAGPQMVELRISQSAAAIVPAVGHPFTYTVTVYNPSPGNASYVQLQEHLPVTATVQQATSTHGSCTIDNGQALCTLGTITNNLTATVTLVVNPQAPGSLTHRVTVRCTEPDTDESNNQAEQTHLIYVAPEHLMLSGPTVGLYGASYPFTATVRSDSGRATFVGVDDHTQGNWGGRYGQAGYILPYWDYGNWRQSLPTYLDNVTYTNINWTAWDWNSSDPRALPGQADNSGRRSITFGYNNSAFDINLVIKDNIVHDVAFYIMDWSNNNTQQRIDLLDAATNAILATSGTQTGFGNGRYVRFQFRGDVKVRFTQLGGGDAVVSGIFFNTQWALQYAPTLPLTYTWQATGQSPVVHVLNDLTPDHVDWLWNQWGRQPITLTVSNIAGSATAYHAIDIFTPPSSVMLSAPAKALIGERYTYTATVAPITATTPITYIWEFAQGGQAENAGWQASYYTNTQHAGRPVVERIENDINFNWGDSAPAPAVPVDNFSARWTRTIYLTSSGVYTFTTKCDDWMSVSVDSTSLLNGCGQIAVPLQPGIHTIVVEFVENYGSASAYFTWMSADGATDPGQRAIVQSSGRSTPLQLRWTQPGPQVITVTAMTPLGNAVNTYTETVLVPPAQATIDGPTIGLYGARHLFSATVPIFTGPAAFLGVDNNTQGNWGGKYGHDGYVLPYWDYGNTRQQLPNYVTAISFANLNPTSWAWSSSDPRVLPGQPDNGGERHASFGYNDQTFDINVDVHDDAVHEIAFYSVDWNNYNTQQRIDLLDPATNRVLATSGIQSGFVNGRYVRFHFRGDVKVRFTHLGGWNAMVSGIFFDDGNINAFQPTLPLTYTWQAAGQSLLIHVVNDHNPDRVDWLWNQWGRQPITLTVSNSVGSATTYHAIDLLTPPAAITISGPNEGLIDQPTVFTATVAPLTTTTPVTYLWELSPGGSLDDGLWQASYWNNTDRSGQPTLQRTEAAIDFDWGWNSSPAPTIQTDSFSARWTRQIYIYNAGAYRFTTQCDDWMRIQVDGRVISEGCPNGVEFYLTNGLHLLVVEYIEHGGYALAYFTYARADGAPDSLGDSRVVQVGGLTDVLTPTWLISGTHTITVTVLNGLDAVSSTHTILVREPQTLVGAVRDGGDLVAWQHLPWSDTLPTGTPYTVYARVGNSATPDNHWSDWAALETPTAGNLTKLPPARYLQWQVTGASTVDLATHIQIGTPTNTAFAYTRAPQRITSNTTWTRAKSPYLITGQVQVGVGVRLTIEPGVTVRFTGPHVFLVEGTLVARGTSTEPITFTSWHMQGQPGDWGFLVFEETAQDATFDNEQQYLSGSALQYVVVEYGGGRVAAAKPAPPGYDYASLGYAVDAVNTSLYVDHTSIRNNQAGGLRSAGGVLTNNTIINNVLTATRDIDGLGIANVGSALLAYNVVARNQIRADYRNYTVRGIGLYTGAGSQVISNVIEYNRAENIQQLYGGGLYVGHGGTVTDNQVRANSGTQINTIYGGGLYVEAESTVQNNTITGNRLNASTIYGGGLALGDGSSALNNRIQDNQAQAENDGRGGGIYSRNTLIQANVVISNTMTSNSYAQSYGGGIYSVAEDWWDAVQNNYHVGGSHLADNTVSANQSSGRTAFGGGIYASGRFSITNNLLRANQVAYIDANDNSQAAYGGGFYAVGGNSGESCGAIGGVLHNNEIVANRALGQRGYAGGAYLVNTALQNSLIVSNTVGGNYGALWWKCDGEVTHTRIANNIASGSTGGLYIEGRPMLNYNAIIDNSGFALNTISQANNPRLNARYNWWGASDEESLDNFIYDFFDNPQRGFVNYIPYLLSAPTLSPTGGTVTGRTAGLVGAAYRFDVSVYPVAALKPMQFQWQTETAMLSHTVNTLNDYATLSWNTPGLKTITITATNAEGSTVITQTVEIAAIGNHDTYENDDACTEAQPITTDGVPQFHTIHQAADVDWVTFPATVGAAYVLEATSPEDSYANMKLEIYSACTGAGVPAQDNSFGPDVSITLNAPATGPLYLRLVDESGAVSSGLAAAYNLSVRTLTQTPEPGLVILVAGKLKATDAVQPNIYKVIEDAYGAFIANGHSADRIYYIAPDLNRDIDQDGNTDVNAISARGSLQTAITDWARTRLQPGQSLTLYLMDHGDQDVFYLNLVNNRLETVEPRELNEWLAEVEAAVPGIKINVIIEACRSGSFITASDLVQTISKPGRVVIASTGALPLAYASPNGGAMFSDVFLAALRRGLSLNSSFAEARWAVQESHPAQTPWLDDNGNGIPNESSDGQLAATRGFAYAGTFDNMEWPPYIASASFAADSGQIQTQVEAQGSSAIQRVWARIYPPSYVPPAEGEELVIETLPEVELYRQDGSNTYVGNYTFSENGAYRVVIYATDSRNLLARPVDASNALQPIPTATMTPTPTATNIAASTPTSTPTPTATSTNSATPTPTATETTTATPTPTMTAPSEVTPTSTATATSTSTAIPTATVTATLTPEPHTATPLPTATHTVTLIPTPVGTSSSTPLPTATAVVTPMPTLPTVTPTPTSIATATVEATITPTATSVPTHTPAATTPSSPTAPPTATATPTSSATPTVTEPAEVTPTPTGVVILPTAASTVVADLETLQTTLTFPPGAVAQPVVVVVAPVATPPATGGFQVLGQVFAINATATDGSPVTHFDQPFTLVVTYTDDEVQGIDEQSLTLHYWHERQQTWIAIPTTVDAANNRLTATLDHLTTFAVLQGQVSNPARIFLPLVQR